jgi:hypothetical protein
MAAAEPLGLALGPGQGLEPEAVPSPTAGSCARRDEPRDDDRRGARGAHSDGGTGDARNDGAAAARAARYRAARQPAAEPGLAPLEPEAAAADWSRRQETPARRQWQLAELC